LLKVVLDFSLLKLTTHIILNILVCEKNIGK